MLKNSREFFSTLFNLCSRRAADSLGVTELRLAHYSVFEMFAIVRRLTISVNRVPKRGTFRLPRPLSLALDVIGSGRLCCSILINSAGMCFPRALGKVGIPFAACTLQALF